MSGDASFTVIVNVAAPVPPVFVAVTVYTACAASTLGVPEIAHVLEVRLRPEGRLGDTLQESIPPPVLPGVWVATATPLVATRLEGENPITGAASFTVIVKVAAPVPPVFEAVIVWTVAPWTALGVPEIAQLVPERLNPAWSAGVTVQPVIAPPVLPGVWVATATPLVATRLEGENAITGAASFTVIVKVAAPVPPVFEAVIV
jgi:hypothetical protein